MDDTKVAIDESAENGYIEFIKTRTRVKQMIHKSATLLGEVKFNNGNQTRIWLGTNHNTGEDIIWQETKWSGKATYAKAHRVTGSNIKKLIDELDFVLKEGEAFWIERPSEAGFEYLKKVLAA